jgi:predicted SnoaL-like aldol condensation-catalyzing enzyme
MQLSRNHTPTESANERAVLAFYDAALNRKDVDGACVFLGENYTQHNPNSAGGVVGFRRFVETLKQTAPQSRSEIVRIFADGDFVIVHVHKVHEPGTPGAAIVDIFRLEDGRIVEHWDVMQAIPKRTVSGNSML